MFILYFHVLPYDLRLYGTGISGVAVWPAYVLLYVLYFRCCCMT